MSINKKETYDIIDNLDNNIVDKKEIEVTNLVLEVKKNLASYLNSLIKSAVIEDNLQELVKTKLIEQIPALNFDQLMRLYTTINKNKSVTNEQLTTLLKPSQQSNSPLFDVFLEVQKEKKDDYTKAYDGMSSEQLRKIDNLDRTLNSFFALLEKKEPDEKGTENESNQN